MTITNILTDALSILCTCLKPAIGEAFEYSWENSTLTKILEHAHPELHYVPSWEDECYDLGTSLTSLAWTDANYHYISHFNDLQLAHPTLVAQPSYRRHTELLGHIE